MSYIEKVFSNGEILNDSDLNNIITEINFKQNLSAIKLNVISTKTKQYINSSNATASRNNYSIDKYFIQGLKTITVFAQADQLAVSTWTTSDGERTRAFIGEEVDNTNMRRTNILLTLDVPETAMYFELSYDYNSPHGVKVLSSNTPSTIQFAGKKIGIIGDSIAAGTSGGFFNTLVDELDATAACNAAKGGWGFGESRIESAELGIYRQVQYLDDDIDLCIVFAGTNDYRRNEAMGEAFYTLDDEVGMIPIVNSATFYGGINKVIEELYTKYTYIPIVFCTILNRKSATDNYGSRKANGRGLYIKDYNESIKEVANFYSIPVFDSGAMTGLDPHNAYINETYFYDGLHPNDEGKKILGKALAKFINNNLYLPN